MGLHVLAHDADRTPIEKQTIECNGRRVRMEFYPGKPPLFCPCCGLSLPDTDTDDEAPA